ncbi:MAG: DNA repair protein RecN [Candidatus Binatia bacterium]|nr:DNA repair protein RecN [Candidatus Binatia bacterium]
MLRSLTIRQLAVVDELTLEFEPGFNVLTGETGAGKSIVIRALSLLCGERANADLVRTAAEEGSVEGLFEEVPSEILDTVGLPSAPDIVVRRVLYRNGRTRAWVNGAAVSAAQLANLGSALVRIYGQHEQTSLLRNETHLDILDAFGALAPLRARMNQAYHAWRALAQRLAEVRRMADIGRERLELLRFQVAELEQAGVTEGEEAALQQEREKLRHVEKLQRLCVESEAALDSGEQPVLSLAARITHALEEASAIDPQLSDSAQLVAQASTLLREAAFQVRRYLDRLEFDPERLAFIEDRLALIARLKRKYACTADDLPQVLQRIRAEAALLEQGTENTETLEREAVRALAEAERVAGELSRERAEAARRLAEKIRKELQALGMGKAVFEVRFQRQAATTNGGASDPLKVAELTASGADEAEFYLSANPGEEPRPLARVASGGELSRVMLALKVLGGGGSPGALWIFDEVDAGIGGTTATAVGKRLRALARQQQVLCITHLPQIAAFADHHLALEKLVRGGRTFTTARAISGEERVRELARMLGSPTAESERYVRELLAKLES